MIQAWTKICVRYRWIVLVVWAVLVLATIPLASHVSRHLTSNGFDNPKSRVTWATNQVQKIKAPPAAPPLLLENLSGSRARALGQRLSMATGDFHPMGSKTLFLPSSKVSVGQVRQLESQVKSAGGTYSVVSQNALAKLVKHDSSSTLTMSLILAIPFLAILLLFVFGSVMSITLPLIIALAGAELTLAVISLISIHVQLSVFLTDIVSFLALGVGIDYALFISTRFRQNLDEGEPVTEAVVDSMSHAGRSVLYSGIAVALAVATLLLGGNAYWRGLALGGSVAIFAVLLATHSLLPATMSLFGRRLYWGRIRTIDWHVWRTIGRLVTRQPVWALLIGLAVLVPFSLLAPNISMSTPANLATMLPVTSPLRQAVEKQQAIQGAGSIAPLAIAIRLPHALTTPASWNSIVRVTTHLSHLNNVASVSSPTSLGVPPAVLAGAVAHPSQAPAALTRGLKNFIAPSDGHLVVLYVTAKTGPNHAKTSRLATTINDHLAGWLPPGTKAAAGGQVPILQSFNHLTSERLPLIIGAALLVALVLLTLATGSLVQALLGVIFDGVVALATAGFLVFVVNHGLFGFQRQPLDSSITPLIFVLLFGLSMDYEVILLHRIQEPMRRGESVRDSVRHGVSTTGAMITGAGMIMVIVFLALLISPLQVMKTIGVGLSFAVLADTWIVRSMLVPSATVLLNRVAFWPWRPRLPERDTM